MAANIPEFFAAKERKKIKELGAWMPGLSGGVMRWEKGLPTPNPRPMRSLRSFAENEPTDRARTRKPILFGLLVLLLLIRAPTAKAAEEVMLFDAEVTLLGPHERTPETAENNWTGEQLGYFWTTVRMEKPGDPAFKTGQKVRLLTSAFDRKYLGKTVTVRLVLNQSFGKQPWLICNNLETTLFILAQEKQRNSLRKNE